MYNVTQLMGYVSIRRYILHITCHYKLSHIIHLLVSYYSVLTVINSWTFLYFTYIGLYQMSNSISEPSYDWLLRWRHKTQTVVKHISVCFYVCGLWDLKVNGEMCDLTGRVTRLRRVMVGQFIFGLNHISMN